MPHYQFVDRPETLTSALGGFERIGVDTEFMREKTYYAELCLVQVATPDEIYCIDPLDDGDHAEFWASLLAQPWVAHSARQDIEVVWQTAGAMPAEIFDTQVAAGLLGYPPQMGYAGLVEELFDVKMDKSHTRADWTRRPLRESWLQYAAEDVEHLLPMHDILSTRLEKAGRLEWAQEDSRFLLDPDLYVIDEHQAIDRLKGARNFRGRRRAAAGRLAAWREAEAIRRNRPRQWIARDTVLLDIAYRLPGSLPELAAIDSMPPKLVSRVGRELLRAVTESANDDNDYKPPQPPNEHQKALLKSMQAKVARRAKELQLAAETVASRKELSAIIISGSRQSRVLRGWRGEIIGDELLALL
ncbi:MAG: ribonuclease D [Gammaproteobacteria bacterium]|nr:ribonuclease D [Gammaproteobacteria bacterium]